MKTRKNPKKKYLAGKIILIEEEKTYYVHEGLIQLWEVHLNGKEVLIDIVQSEMLVDIPENPTVLYELRIKETAVLETMDLNDLNNKQILDMKLYKRLRDHIHRTQEMFMINRMKYVDERLLMLLSVLAKRFGQTKSKDRQVIIIPLTHEEIASAINSTRSTVTRILKNLQQQGFISFIQSGRHRYILLKNKSLLSHISLDMSRTMYRSNNQT